MGKPTLKQVLDALAQQVLNGKAYLQLGQGLLQADQALFSGSPTFFGLTIDGSLELAQMAVARLYDVTTGAITVPLMLSRAALEVGAFQHGTAAEISAAINEFVSRSLLDLNRRSLRFGRAGTNGLLTWMRERLETPRC